MPALVRRAHSIRKSATALLALAALALCAFQFEDRYGLNSMPFAQVLGRMGVPGSVLKGSVLDAGGTHALAVDGLAQ